MIIIFHDRENDSFNAKAFLDGLVPGVNCCHFDFKNIKKSGFICHSRAKTTVETILQKFATKLSSFIRANISQGKSAFRVKG